jgi:hypothetical protein
MLSARAANIATVASIAAAGLSVALFVGGMLFAAIWTVLHYDTPEFPFSGVAGELVTASFLAPLPLALFGLAISVLFARFSARPAAVRSSASVCAGILLTYAILLALGILSGEL